MRGRLGRQNFVQQQRSNRMLQRCARGRLGRRRARYTRDARDKAKRIALARYERLMQYTTLSEIAEALGRWESDRGHRDADIRNAWSALAAWRDEVQTAEAEATRLWSVVQTEGSTMSSMEVALARSPKRCCDVLPSCREGRAALEQLLNARKAELSRWQTRLTHLTAASLAAQIVCARLYR